jgi:hypothetical protein
VIPSQNGLPQCFPERLPLRAVEKFESTVSASQSTWPSFTLPFKFFAAVFHSGASFLQWPHQGAKNSTSHMSSLWMTSLSKLAVVRSTDALAPPSFLPPDFFEPVPLFPLSLSKANDFDCPLHHKDRDCQKE